MYKLSGMPASTDKLPRRQLVSLSRSSMATSFKPCRMAKHNTSNKLSNLVRVWLFFPCAPSSSDYLLLRVLARRGNWQSKRLLSVKLPLSLEPSLSKDSLKGDDSLLSSSEESISDDPLLSGGSPPPPPSCTVDEQSDLDALLKLPVVSRRFPFCDKHHDKINNSWRFGSPPYFGGTVRQVVSRTS